MLEHNRFLYQSPRARSGVVKFNLNNSTSRSMPCALPKRGIEHPAGPACVPSRRNRRRSKLRLSSQRSRASNFCHEPTAYLPRSIHNPWLLPHQRALRCGVASLPFLALGGSPLHLRGAFLVSLPGNTTLPVLLAISHPHRTPQKN
jgi:hypothetical protein